MKHLFIIILMTILSCSHQQTVERSPSSAPSSALDKETFSCHTSLQLVFNYHDVAMNLWDILENKATTTKNMNEFMSFVFTKFKMTARQQENLVSKIEELQIKGVSDDDLKAALMIKLRQCSVL